MDCDLLGNEIDTKSNLLGKELMRHPTFGCKLENKTSCVAYVDGSFNSGTSTYGFGAVLVVDSHIFEVKGSGKEPELAKMRNVSGEILGCMYVVKWCMDNNIKHINIHYDYMGIECWANTKWKAKKKETQEYRDFMKCMMEKIDIEFTKVKSHSGHGMNDRADILAKMAVGVGLD